MQRIKFGREFSQPQTSQIEKPRLLLGFLGNPLPGVADDLSDQVAEAGPVKVASRLRRSRLLPSRQEQATKCYPFRYRPCSRTRCVYRQ